MRVLIACEVSGTVRDEFLSRGHDAWSCDIKPAESLPERHLLGDAREVLEMGWDLMIAHPPCTYLSSSGMHWTVRGLRDPAETERAIEFVRQLWAAPIARVCIENPVGVLSTRWRRPSQYIQPYQFGDDASKRTALWLRGLPPLISTRSVDPRIVNGRARWANQTDSGQNRLGPSPERAAIRATTYPGVAAAMAHQWHDFRL